MALTKDKGELRVVALQIKDVLGAAEASLKFGRAVTILEGPNESGKSTILAALQAALGGGNLAKLARVNKDGTPTGEPEVVLLLEGEGSEAYRAERKGDKARVRSRVGDTEAFEDVPKPQAWLSSLYDPQGANPVRFLTAADKDRALLLLEALDLKFDRPALLAEMGVEEKELPAIPRGLHPLLEVEMIRDAVFRARTGVNRDQKSAAAAADQVRRATPAVLPGDPSAELQQLEVEAREQSAAVAQEEEAAKAAHRAAGQAADAEHSLVEGRLIAEFKAWVQKRRGEHERKAAEIRAAAEKRIADLLAEVETEIDGRRTADERELERADEGQAAAREAAATAYEAALDALKTRREDLERKVARLGELRGQADLAKKAATLHEQAKAFDVQAEQLDEESKRLTAALAALDGYRRRMAEDLPIPGLEIEGQVIRVHGVPFEQLNAAQRTAIAVEVATLRARGSRLPVIFVDDAEKLDRQHFDALVDELRRRKVQAVVARVTDGPFKVTTADEATARP